MEEGRETTNQARSLSLSPSHDTHSGSLGRSRVGTVSAIWQRPIHWMHRATVPYNLQTCTRVACARAYERVGLCVRVRAPGAAAAAAIVDISTAAQASLPAGRERWLAGSSEKRIQGWICNLYIPAHARGNPSGRFPSKKEPECGTNKISKKVYRIQVHQADETRNLIYQATYVMLIKPISVYKACHTNLGQFDILVNGNLCR